MNGWIVLSAFMLVLYIRINIKSRIVDISRKGEEIRGKRSNITSSWVFMLAKQRRNAISLKNIPPYWIIIHSQNISYVSWNWCQPHCFVMNLLIRAFVAVGSFFVNMWPLPGLITWCVCPWCGCSSFDNRLDHNGSLCFLKKIEIIATTYNAASCFKLWAYLRHCFFGDMSISVE